MVLISPQNQMAISTLWDRRDNIELQGNFRLLTPTQYHNEGYKPEEIRDNTINANCPVPVFLCLSANATLSLDGTLFAEKGLAEM